MKKLIHTKKCLGYFETVTEEEIFEICAYNVTGSELILEAAVV